MPQFLTDPLTKAKGSWSRCSGRARLGLVALALLALVALAALPALAVLPGVPVTAGAVGIDGSARPAVPGGQDRPAPDRDGFHFIALQDAWQARLQANAVRAIEPAFHDRVRVIVNLELDQNLVRRTGVDLPPEGLPPTSLETSSETRSETRPGAGSGRGSAGADPDSDDPDVAPIVADPAARDRSRPAGPSRIDRRHSEKRVLDPTLYGRKTVAQIAPFIRRITASVLISEAALAVYADAATRREKTGEIQRLVEAAIGFQADRDRVSTAVLQFPEAPPAAAAASGPDPASAAPSASISTAAPHGESLVAAAAQIVVVLLVLGFLVRLLKGVEPLPEPRSPVDGTAAPAPGLAPVPAPARTAASDEPSAPGAEEQREPPEAHGSAEATERLREAIECAILDDPAAVSRMLEGWLTERKA